MEIVVDTKRCVCSRFARCQINAVFHWFAVIRYAFYLLDCHEKLVDRFSCSISDQFSPSFFTSMFALTISWSLIQLASNQFDNVLAHSPHVAQSLLFIGIFRSVRMEACGRSRFMFAYRSEMLTNERFYLLNHLNGRLEQMSRFDAVSNWYGLKMIWF